MLAPHRVQDASPAGSGRGVKLTAAGVRWDAVRLPSYLGDRVREALGEHCGAVIRDPYGHRLYFLISPGAADRWVISEAACTRVLGEGCWIAVPPAGRVLGAGPHWVQPPAEDRMLTPSRRLRDAMATVFADAGIGGPGAGR